jgi:hypothetical protein
MVHEGSLEAESIFQNEAFLAWRERAFDSLRGWLVGHAFAQTSSIECH